MPLFPEEGFFEIKPESTQTRLATRRRETRAEAFRVAERLAQHYPGPVTVYHLRFDGDQPRRITKESA